MSLKLKPFLTAALLVAAGVGPARASKRSPKGVWPLFPNCEECPENWSYSCSLTFSMNDEFSGILDLDNSGDDPWDDWTLGGTPFSVFYTWTDKVSGKGAL